MPLSADRNFIFARFVLKFQSSNTFFVFRKDDELANMQEALDKEMHDRQKLVKELRAVQNQNQELKEDLDAEKANKLKCEKARRDLSEELESLKTELDEGIDSAAKNTELRVQREQEIIHVRNELETERANYEKVGFLLALILIKNPHFRRKKFRR